MRLFITRLSTVVLLSACSITAKSQTIPASTSTSLFGAINSCNNCTITLDPGVVLTVNSNVTCTNCTFIGGTVLFSSGTVTLKSTCTFQDDTVIINTPLTSIQSMNFNGDSVAINAALTYSTSGTTITNSSVRVAASTAFNSISMTNDRIHASAAITSNGATLTNTALTLSGNGTFSATAPTVNGSNIVMNGTSTAFNINSTLSIGTTDITMNSASSLTSAGAMNITGGSITTGGKIKSGGALTLAGDTLVQTAGYIAGSSITTTANGAVNTSITMSGAARDSTNGSISMTNTNIVLTDSSAIKGSSLTYSTGTITMTKKAALAPSNGLTLTTANVSMADSSYITAGSMTLQTGSYVTVGDGTGASMASITIQNGLKVLDTSTLAISGNNNFFVSGNNNYSVASGNKPVPGNLNCGGTGQNTCRIQTVFGCATMNAAGAVACTILANAGIDFSAIPAGDHTVNVSWSDPQYTSADQYQVERSAAGGDWITLATVSANGYAGGSYHVEDAAAPAGTDNYRIVRIDQNGATTWSDISSVTLTTTATAITVFPNPATGHTFNIAAPTTDQLILNVYSLTGQLIMRTTLKGGTLYPVRLPSQLPVGTTVIVQTIMAERTSSFPVMLR
jgi:hypothetical protein